jgi:hypothetical protein
MSGASPSAKRDMLNALSIDTMKLHSGYPGLTGANEVSGGSPAYAAKACSFALSSAGEPRTLSGSVVFDVPAATVLWASIWSGATIRFIAPTGGDPVEFFADLTANAIKVPAHGYANDDTIVFFSSSPPSPLTAGTIYYVVNAATDDFQVSETSGGAAINITTNAAPDCLVSKIVPRVYAAQDTHTVGSYTFGLPY